jgi:hypothetical protein
MLQSKMRTAVVLGKSVVEKFGHFPLLGLFANTSVFTLRGINVRSFHSVASRHSLVSHSSSSLLSERAVRDVTKLQGSLVFHRGYATCSAAELKERELIVCQKICSNFYDTIDFKKFHQDLKVFFERGGQHMRDQYKGDFLFFLTSVRDGMNKALESASDRGNAIRALADAYGGRYYSFGRAVCNFCNLTARAAHLYGDPEKGYLNFNMVKGLVDQYNRYGLTSRGLDENSIFLILCHNDTKKMIKSGALTPKEAWRFAEEIESHASFLRHGYPQDNPLSAVAKKIHDRNFAVRSMLGASA